MIELYTHPMSPCAQKVRLVLAEKQLDWLARPIDLPAKENLEPWYLKLNPLGVVPTLVHDGKPVVESSIICEYLEDTFPDIALRPVDPYRRARMRFWMKHVDTKLHPSCGALQWPLAMLPSFMKKSEQERERLLDQIPEKPRRERQKRLVKYGLDAPDVVDAVRTYHQTIADMEEALSEHSWIIGDRFSFADCSLAPYFQTLFQFGWTGFYKGAFPSVTDWFDRCRVRASYQTAVMADFSPDMLADLNKKGTAAWPKIERHLSVTA